MNSIIARIRRVLTGHSETGLLHAIDAHGHEHRLELPAAALRGVAPGQLVVLQWAVHDLPEVSDMGAGIEVEPVVITSAASSQASGEIDDATLARSTAPPAGEMSGLERLLGLSPGRLGGA